MFSLEGYCLLPALLLDEGLVDAWNYHQRLRQFEPGLGLALWLSAGVDHTCVIKAPGELFCWGGGAFGRLGLGSNTSMNTPAPVPDFLLQ